MFKRLKDWKVKRREERERIERQWVVTILKDGIWIDNPRFFELTSQWERCGRMQAELLLHLQKQWSNTQLYIRVHSYMPDYYTNSLKTGDYVIVPGSPEGEYILLIQNYQDDTVLGAILAGSGHVPFSKTVFIIEGELQNWQKELIGLFEITKKLSKGHQVSEFQEQLSSCRCICYTMDNDLIIAKLDLPESQLLSFLQSQSHKEGLDLVIGRDTQI